MLRVEHRAATLPSYDYFLLACTVLQWQPSRSVSVLLGSLAAFQRCFEVLAPTPRCVTTVSKIPIGLIFCNGVPRWYSRMTAGHCNLWNELLSPSMISAHTVP